MRKCFFVLACELFLASAAAADTASISPKKDNTIYSESEFTNGGGQHLFAGTTQDNNYRRAIISFDIAANVPAGSRIDGATLTLHLSRTNPGAQPVMVQLYPCLKAWGEGTVVGPLGEGGGGPAQPGDATWSFNLYNVDRWISRGGDYVQASSGSTLVGNEIGLYTWSSEQMARDVQSWLDATETNFGWVLVADGEGHRPITAKRFDSRENLSVELRPVLRIVYTPPMPEDGGVPDAGNDAGGGPDDAGPRRDGGHNAGDDAGAPTDAGVSEDPPAATGPGDRHIDEVGRGGCQAVGGPTLILVALSALVLARTRRALPRAIRRGDGLVLSARREARAEAASSRRTDSARD